MSSRLDVEPTPGTSGKIRFTGFIYTASTGLENCKVYSTQTLLEDRAFFQFDTSPLPDDCTITKVEFYIWLNASQPGGVPDVYRLKFFIGDIIGSVLNGVAAEWTGGTYMTQIEAMPSNGDLVDLDDLENGPEAYVNKTGNTDIKIDDDGVQGSGDPEWGTDFNGAKTNCELRISYGVPTAGSATATGRGSTSAAGTVIRRGSATATGTGSTSAAGTVIRRGSATATGRGSTSAAGTVIRRGSATATGAGSTSAAGTVIRRGSATATGRGSSTAAGTVIRLPPLAIHSATRTITPVDQATRTITPVDQATLTLGGIDEATRGARRN